MSNNHFFINGRQIGEGHPPFIIAELSANHNGSIERALKSIEAAYEAGADAIKIQSYTPDTITIDSKNPEFMINKGLWKGQSLYELYQKAYTPFEWHPLLFEKAASVGITIFSSPFDFTAIEMLEKLNTPAYKIASFELVDLPLVKMAASTGKPIIMSTGMATFQEIERAVEAAKTTGNNNIALLHCVSSYPAALEDTNLNTMIDLKEKFDVVVGLSDHSLGHNVCLAATALGASLIEKHFMLDDDGGPDASFSLTSDQLSGLVTDTRNTWFALGNVHYGPLEGESISVSHRRSLYVVSDVRAGEEFTIHNLRSIRPGNGLEPRFYEQIIGKKASRDIERGTPASWEMLSD